MKIDIGIEANKREEIAGGDEHDESGDTGQRPLGHAPHPLQTRFGPVHPARLSRA